MIAPEVWNFPPPPCSFQFEEGDMKHSECAIKSSVADFHFNHSVSIVLPDTVMVPSNILDGLTEDCDYYKLSDVPLSEFIQIDFINAFVKKGKVTVLSVSTKLDTDDCACLTPSGHLVLALGKVTYEELGLEGQPSYFCRQKPATRYIVTIDLTADFFKPGKKNYERVQWCLTDRLNLKFNFLLAWDPPDKETCPSSVAAYFASRGLKVELCHPQVRQRRETAVVVPSMGECDNEELLEWLGAFSIQADLETGSEENFVTTYQPPVCSGENQPKLQVAYLQWSGFFTATNVCRLLNNLKDYVQDRNSLPWVSLHTQGFDDSPVSWGLQEHHFVQCGDNAYTLFLRPDLSYLSCRTMGARRKPLTRSRRTAKS